MAAKSTKARLEARIDPDLDLMITEAAAAPLHCAEQVALMPGHRRARTLTARVATVPALLVKTAR